MCFTFSLHADPFGPLSLMKYLSVYLPAFSRWSFGCPAKFTMRFICRHIWKELDEHKCYRMSTVAWRCSTNHFVRTAGEDALWKVQAQEDAGHSPHIDGIGEGEAQHDFWSSEKRGNVITYLVSKGKSKKRKKNHTPKQQEKIPVSQCLQHHPSLDLGEAAR